MYDLCVPTTDATRAVTLLLTTSRGPSVSAFLLPASAQIDELDFGDSSLALEEGNLFGGRFSSLPRSRRRHCVTVVKPWRRVPRLGLRWRVRRRATPLCFLRGHKTRAPRRGQRRWTSTWQATTRPGTPTFRAQASRVVECSPLSCLHHSTPPPPFAHRYQS